jgi:hypothetical protein
VRIRFGCALDSRIYGSSWHEERFGGFVSLLNLHDIESVEISVNDIEY